MLLKLKQTNPKATSLEELTDHQKRDSINFLNYLFKDLDKKIPPKLPTPLQKGKSSKAQVSLVPPSSESDASALCSTIVYGAMSLVCKQIEKTFGGLTTGSFTHEALLDVMGINETNQPSNFQQKVFFIELNTYFKTTLFFEGDSLKGINPENPFKFLDFDTLTALIKASYKLNRTFAHNALDEFTLDSDPVAARATFRLRGINNELIKPFEDWTQINTQFEQLLSQELVDKNTARVGKLKNSERANQIHFLTILRDTLNSIPTNKLNGKEKTAIFLGAMYLIREQIAQEYNQPLLSIEGTGGLLVSGSKVHGELTRIVQLKTTSPEHIELLVHAANVFILSMKTSNPQQFQAAHLFSSLKDFNLVELLKLAQSIIKFCRVQALDNAIAIHQLTNKPAINTKQSSGLVGGIVSVLGLFTSVKTTQKIGSTSTLALNDGETTTEKKDECANLTLTSIR